MADGRCDSHWQGQILYDWLSFFRLYLVPFACGRID
jgi:hypothetical protein